MIPFLSFDYQDKLYRELLINEMIDVLDSKWYILGNKVQIFETEYAKLHKTNFALGVANGLDALIISLKVIGIKPGDEVLVPSNTYIASWLAVSALGAIPIPIEPDEETYNINPLLIEQNITKKTKAILPVHLYGQSCDMISIMNIASKYNLFVVEDNAQAHLATWAGKITGSFGHINATSFYPGKNLGALGDGGGITTNSEDYFSKAKIYRNYGSEKKYFNEMKGINSRLDELQAGILSIKLRFLNDLTIERQKIAKKYIQLLSTCKDVVLPKTADMAQHVYHLFVILCDRRDELKAYLDENEISTLIHYPVPPHLQLAYKELGYQRGDFPIAEKIADNCLSLPMYPGLSDEQVEKICLTIKNFFIQ